MNVVFPKTDKHVVVVLSGGLDSTILTYKCVEEYGSNNVFALSFDYNQKQKHELTLAQKTCNHLGVTHKILDLSVLGEISKDVCANIQNTDVIMPTIKDVLGDPQPKTYVPYRNMILNAITFSFAESVDAEFVFSGLQSTDAYGYWDTTQEFVNSMNLVSSLNRKQQIKLVAPFAKLSKKDELALIKDTKNVRLDYTLTCYNPDGMHRSCGKCPSCAERISAFMQNNMIDPVVYSVDINWDA